MRKIEGSCLCSCPGAAPSHFFRDNEGFAILAAQHAVGNPGQPALSRKPLVLRVKTEADPASPRLFSEIDIPIGQLCAEAFGDSPLLLIPLMEIQTISKGQALPG